MILTRTLLHRPQLLPIRHVPRYRTIASSQRSAAQARIVEVGPRDGLQNEETIVPLATKLELIRKLSETGLRDIEVGAFVSPKWVPQMKNSAEILAYLYSNRPKSPEAISYSFLVPNIKGLQNALAVSATRPNFSEVAKSSATITPPQTPPADGDLHGSHFTEIPKELKLDEISVFAAATETFSRKNLNCSISESLERFKPVIALATSKDIRVRAYISVVLGCPYEGQNVSSGHVVDLSAELLRMGADEISLGDTTGMGTAPRTSALLRILKRVVPIDKIAMHFHDTYGQALVNTEVAVTEGIRTFDSSVSGLGGCPYAKGATGNVATEDLVYFMHSIGLDTGVDIERMADIGSWISKELGRENGSRVGKALLAKRR